MSEEAPTRCTAFVGTRRIARGGLAEVAVAAKSAVDAGADAPVLIFDDATGRVIDVDFRGTAAEVRKRLAAGVAASTAETSAGPPARRGPGRPRLGVVAREVTLLPRHWEWLSRQPGGASVALRKLVDEARRVGEGRDRVREAREVAYRFMSAMAGDEPGFEEATRALFAGDRPRFEALTEGWPGDVREHARRLAEGSFRGAES